MIHLKNTKSTIISKGISAGPQNSYRFGKFHQMLIMPETFRNDSLLRKQLWRAYFPYIEKKIHQQN
jgi:hypothetical protein